jgi:hypothetical protein
MFGERMAAAWRATADGRRARSAVGVRLPSPNGWTFAGTLDWSQSGRRLAFAAP